MKRIILIAAVLFGAAVASSAQSRSLGVILGYHSDISYQHTAGGANFVEFNVGTFGFDALNLEANYNFMIAQPNWTSKGEWGFYAGPGLSIGTGFNKGYAFSLAVNAQIGLEYTFWFPLQLALDLRPSFGFVAGKEHFSFFEDGATMGFIPTLSVRYRF